jgi:hypothetical protein
MCTCVSCNDHSPPPTKEYENDAELAVKEIVFYEDDTALDRELKLTMLAIYNERLTRRVARKQFAQAYSLTNAGLMEGAGAGEPRRTAEALRCFARLMAPCEYVRAVECSVEEARLRERIGMLHDARRMGVTRRRDMLTYQQEKRKRDARLARMHSSGASGSASGSSVQGRRALKAVPAFPVDKMPSAHLLSAEELQVCVCVCVCVCVWLRSLSRPTPTPTPTTTL